MKNHLESVQHLRANNTPHHNCAQAVLVTFAEEMELTHHQAYNMGAHFGAGMGCGSTCGVLTGAVMTLGMLGYTKSESTHLLNQFKEKHGYLDCKDLLLQCKNNNIPKSQHCDQLIFDAVEHLSKLEEEKNITDSKKEQEENLLGIS